MRTHAFRFAHASITRDNYDFEQKAAAQRDNASKELLPTFWINPATVMQERLSKLVAAFVLQGVFSCIFCMI